MVGPALALLEIADVPSGLRALDALSKEASVTVVSAGTVQCGHFLVLFGGEVEPVTLSYDRATAIASAALVDEVLLAHAEPRILPAVRDAVLRKATPGDTLGVVQTASSPSILRGVDAALKGAWVELVELRVAEGLGGRAIATLWGETHDVEAAVALAEGAIARGRRSACTTAVIANADHAVGQAIGGGSRFFKEWRG